MAIDNFSFLGSDFTINNNYTIDQTFSDLQKVHKLHLKFINDWEFFGSAYEGGQPFVDFVLKQHPREELEDFLQRKDEAINFNYSRSIINLYTHFLTEAKPSRDSDGFKGRKDWAAFIENSDLYGTPFDTFLAGVSQISAAFGTAGVLVDKPGGVFNKDANLAPYCSVFTPPNILDWKFKRDPMKRILVLEFIKLKEDDDNYLIWTTDQWARYTMNESRSEIENVSIGENPLDEIPFVWVPNIKTIQYPYLGYSDLVDISRINASIIRNMSFSEEVLRYAAFPMLRMPKELDNQYNEDNGSGGEEEVIIGNSAVLDFDPEYGVGGQPNWMETKVQDPISAIHANVDLKVEECYRTALLGGVYQNKEQAQTKSGTALKFEFIQLNSILSKKSDSLIEAEKRIVDLFCMWQQCEELAPTYSIARQKRFSIEEIAEEIEYSFSAIEKVPSESFKRCMYKHVANILLPSVSESKIATIEEEIDSASFEKEAAPIKEDVVITEPISSTTS